MTFFKGSLGNYRIIKTEDHTETVYSEYFSEACHNISGAYQETLHNYIEGCDIKNKLEILSELNILDVGFGIGVGLQALLDLHSKKTINYYSIEIDEDFLKWTLQKYFNRQIAPVILGDLIVYQCKIENVFINIFLGDGRKSIPIAHEKNLIPPLNAIFQDPFSPKRNPTLWTVEWFTLLKSLSSQDVRLSTYSSSVSIRKSLLKAGFTIENDKGFKGKRTMTKACLTGETSPELLEQLKRSPTLEIDDKSIKIKEEI